MNELRSRNVFKICWKLQSWLAAKGRQGCSLLVSQCDVFAALIPTKPQERGRRWQPFAVCFLTLPEICGPSLAVGPQQASLSGTPSPLPVLLQPWPPNLLVSIHWSLRDIWFPLESIPWPHEGESSHPSPLTIRMLLTVAHTCFRLLIDLIIFPLSRQNLFLSQHLGHVCSWKIFAELMNGHFYRWENRLMEVKHPRSHRWWRMMW